MSQAHEHAADHGSVKSYLTGFVLAIILFTKEGKLNSFSFLFTAMIIVMLVGLSVWIISTADALMLR